MITGMYRKEIEVVRHSGTTMAMLSHTGNHYPSRRRGDVMEYLLLSVGIVIWVAYLS